MKRFEVLDRNEIDEIDDATLTVLERVGMIIHEEEARNMLRKNGASVDDKTKLVKIPRGLVKEGVSKAPGEFTICARDPKYNVRTTCDVTYFEPMIGRLNILDSRTGVRRRTTLADLDNLMRIANAMPNFQLLHSGAMMPHIEGVSDSVSHVYGYLSGVNNAQKVVKGTGRGRKRSDDCIRMASVLAGGMESLKKTPYIFTTCNTIAPLQLGADMTEGLIEYARHGQPVDVASEVQSGATSPVTLAGSLVIQNAEVLCGILISQLVNPGTPVFYGTCGGIMDMRTGNIALGTVEAGLINAASAQLAHHYGIPCRGTGATTESKVLDMQAGYEKTITLLTAALGGINCLFYPGVVEHALTISLESLVIDDDICGMVSRLIRGITVDDRHLAVDVIENVGAGGHFLGQKHTMDYLTQEHYFPTLSDRKERKDWEKDGARELKDAAAERVRQILEEHTPMALEPDKLKELNQIVKEVEERERAG